LGILETEIGDIESNLGYCNACGFNTPYSSQITKLIHIHYNNLSLFNNAIGDIEFFTLYLYSFNYAFQLSKQASMAEVVGMYASILI